MSAQAPAAPPDDLGRKATVLWRKVAGSHVLTDAQLEALTAVCRAVDDLDEGSRRPPAGLGRRGRAFWRKVVGVFVLTEAEAELLEQACRLEDACALLEAAIEEQGTTIKGSAGQLVLHPAFAEIRQHRLAFGRLVAQLNLPDDAVSGAPKLLSPQQRRASMAAKRRWDKTPRLAGGTSG